MDRLCSFTEVIVTMGSMTAFIMVVLPWGWGNHDITMGMI